MKTLQGSAAGKLAASLLVLAFAFAGALCAAHVLLALPYVGVDSWQETDCFYQLLYARETALAAGYADTLKLLEDQDLNYLERKQLQENVETIWAEMSADATWFRFQIWSADGEQVLYSNLPEGETLPVSLETVHYASFVAGEYYVSQDTVLYQTADTMPSHTSSDSTSESADSGEMTVGAAVGQPEILIIECCVRLNTVDYENGAVNDEFSTLMSAYLKSRSTLSQWVAGFLALLGLAVASMLYVLWTAGHKAGVEGVVLTWQEKIFFDLYLAVMLAAGAAGFMGMLHLCDALIRYSYSYYDQTGVSNQVYDLLAPITSALAALLMGIVTLTLRTLVVRLKARALARTMLACRICGWLWRTCWELIWSLPFLWKVAAAFGAYFFLDLMLFTQSRYDGLAGLLWWLLNLAVFLLLCWWAMGFRRLRKGGQAIAAGNLEYQIDTHRMPHDLKAHAEDLNNISVGLAGAVDEKMKSERFKAELITNVSHDLKTPLTSIINYVNLLKKTEQTDPKALEYIEVLDRKSQRLKKLTEDLVEASKASTGVLAVNREKIGMVQLIGQALGEWEEKLEARKLTVVTSLPDGETWVYADGRHVWRVIDNLLSNCAKYAMEGTRVYLNLSRGKGQVILSVKNISREALNIPPERLMERFVRGEESRATEGSGLGLSIARSLTELQGGTFELMVDGDLFKAVVTLPQAN